MKFTCEHCTLGPCYLETSEDDWDMERGLARCPAGGEADFIPVEGDE